MMRSATANVKVFGPRTFGSPSIYTNSVVDCANILSYDNLATGDDALANIANNDICFSLHILSNSHSKFTQIR